MATNLLQVSSDINLLFHLLEPLPAISETSDKGHSEYRTPLYKGHSPMHQPI